MDHKILSYLIENSWKPLKFFYMFKPNPWLKRNMSDLLGCCPPRSGRWRWSSLTPRPWILTAPSLTWGSGWHYQSPHNVSCVMVEVVIAIRTSYPYRQLPFQLSSGKNRILITERCLRFTSSSLHNWLRKGPKKHKFCSVFQAVSAIML